MVIDIHEIFKMLVPQRSRHEQLILATGDEDFSPSDILDWIKPMLAGMPEDGWSSCEFNLIADDVVFARYRDGRSPNEFSLHSTWAQDEMSAFKSLIPMTCGLAMVMMGEHTSQLFTLVDSVASWLNIYEASQVELAPLMKVFDTLARMARIYE